MKKVLSQNKWFLFHNQRPFAHTNLFCFHHAGGSASFFTDWQKYLPALVQLIAVQLPGRENRYSETFLSDIDLVVDEIMENKEVFTEKPCIFFGHSFGALIAFELSRRLQTHKAVQPKCLIVSGHCAPKFLTEREKLYALPDDKFLEKINEKYGGLSHEVLNCPELLSLILPILRADIYASENYSYSKAEALDCPIFVFNGAKDISINRDKLFAWKEETTDGMKLYDFPGDHFFINTSKEEVIARINKILIALECQ